MSKKHDCTICKHLFHLPEDVPVYLNELYYDEGRVQKMHLCYIHDIELFKIGQYRFVDKYRHIAENLVASDDASFISFLRNFGRGRRKKEWRY